MNSEWSKESLTWKVLRQRVIWKIENSYLEGRLYRKWRRGKITQKKLGKNQFDRNHSIKGRRVLSNVSLIKLKKDKF